MRALKVAWAAIAIGCWIFVLYRVFTDGSLIEQVGVIAVTVGAILAVIAVTGIAALGRDAEARHQETLAAIRERLDER
jgi:hypothetical protein